jgi:[ribosomal protein S5]-alanine N-acetyltransferase
MGSPGWPVTVYEGRVGLRPLRVRDAATWSDLRLRNESWLSPWDGRPPDAPEQTWAERSSATAYGVALRTYRREAKAGRCLPFGITLDGDLVGQLTIANVVRGALQGATVGYWVSQHVAGQGVVPTALALAVDHCFAEAGLHRIEAGVRPENAPSLRVVRKLGFREEGCSRRFLWIDGDWRDHLIFALTPEDVPEGLVARWRALQRA